MALCLEQGTPAGILSSAYDPWGSDMATMLFAVCAIIRGAGVDWLWRGCMTQPSRASKRRAQQALRLAQNQSLHDFVRNRLDIPGKMSIVRAGALSKPGTQSGVAIVRADEPRRAGWLARCFPSAFFPSGEYRDLQDVDVQFGKAYAAQGLRSGETRHSCSHSPLSVSPVRLLTAHKRPTDLPRIHVLNKCWVQWEKESQPSSDDSMLIEKVLTGAPVRLHVQCMLWKAGMSAFHRMHTNRVPARHKRTLRSIQIVHDKKLVTICPPVPSQTRPDEL
eukprot:1138807-Pelagomonas_calceolata.AAC.4